MMRRFTHLWPYLAASCLLLTTTVHAESVPAQIADLKEETTLTRQACGDLQLSLEALERRHRDQERRLAQLELELKANRSEVAHLQQEVQTRDAQLREALVNQESRLIASVSERLQAFGKQTQRAIDKLAYDTHAKHDVRNDTSLAQLHSQAGRVHVVGPGETLSGIARMYHISVSLLQRINDVKDPTRLQVGQDLFIPEPE